MEESDHGVFTDDDDDDDDDWTLDDEDVNETHGLFGAASSSPASPAGGKRENVKRDDDLEDLEADLFASDGSDGW